MAANECKPSGVVPTGPIIDLTAPHNRSFYFSKLLVFISHHLDFKP